MSRVLSLITFSYQHDSTMKNTIQIIMLTIIASFVGRQALAQDSFEQLMDEAYALYEMQSYEEAIAAFGKAAVVKPDEPEVYYLRGVCRSLLGEMEKALVDYDKALALDPEYAEVYFEKGYLYFMESELEKALENFNKAIDLNPEYGEAFQNRGTLKCMMEDKKGAKEDWEKAKSLGVDVPFNDCD